MKMGSSKILLVEDDPLHRQFVYDLLTRHGWLVAVAADAHDAFLIGRQFEPDVLVADWVLPDKITGGVLATLLREFSPSLHLVFITGLPIADVKAQAGHLAACDFIQKPYSPGVLIAAIERGLNNQADAGPQNPPLPAAR